MANVYEFVIALKDQSTAVAERIKNAIETIDNIAEKTTASMQKMQGKSQSALSKIYNSAKSAIKGPQTLSHSIEDLKFKLEALNHVKFSTKIKSEFDAVNQEIKKTEKQLARLEQGISGNGLSSKMKGWRTDFANSLPGADLIQNPLSLAGAAVGGLWTATEKAMEAGKEKVKMQTLTGSAEIGSALFDGLTKFATDTVFGTEVYDMGARMLASGVEDSELLPLMKQLGDISMGDAEKLGSLSHALSKVQGKGKLTGEELMQMTEAGFNPLAVISEKTGEGMESLYKRMEKGEITFADVRKAMDSATGKGGDFYKMLEKVANTPYGKLEAFKGQLEQMMVKIGEVFLPIASKMMDFFSWMSTMLGPLLQPVAVVLGGLAVGILAAAAAQWVLNLAFLANPVTWIIAGVIALIGVIVWLISKISGWGEAWKIVVNNAKLNWEVFTSGAKLLWNGMVDGFMIGLNKIKSGWYQFKNAVGIGDESENNNALTQIAEDTKKRTDEIEKSKKDFYAKSSSLQKNQKNAFEALSWNKDSSSIVDTTKKIKKKLGITELGNSGGLAKNPITDKKGNSLQNATKKTSDGIVSGGSKQTTFNITIGKLNEKIEINTTNLKEGGAEIEQKFQELLLRVVNSVNQMQTT